jgi:hypothetical protein
MNAGQKSRIVDAIWNINKISTNTNACAISTGFVSSLEGSIFTGLANNQIGISRYDGANWTVASGSGDNVANTATATGFTSFGAFGVGQVGLALPVKITSFNAKAINGTVLLNWTVEKEIDIASYTIERSLDGISFTQNGTVTATNQFTYSLTDFAPSTNNYYRIKVIGKDNGISYTSTINLKMNTIIGDISIYPNPVKNELLNIQLSSLTKGTTGIKIYNPTGLLVYTSSFIYDGGVSLKTIKLDRTNIKGIYIAVINLQNQSKQYKFIVE